MDLHGRLHRETQNVMRVAFPRTREPISDRRDLWSLALILFIAIPSFNLD